MVVYSLDDNIKTTALEKGVIHSRICRMRPLSPAPEPPTPALQRLPEVPPVLEHTLHGLKSRKMEGCLTLTRRMTSRILACGVPQIVFNQIDLLRSKIPPFIVA